MKEHVKKVIHHARSQSVPRRKQIALVATLVAMVFIVAIWILTFRFGNPKPVVDEATGTTRSPFSVFGDTFKSIFSSSKETVKTIITE
jgi:hypothetical protein